MNAAIGEHGPARMSLGWFCSVAVDSCNIEFGVGSLVCGLVCWFFCFPPSSKIGAGEMQWLGSAPGERDNMGRGAEVHLLVVLSWVEIC